jgi:hypothetical protein
MSWSKSVEFSRANSNVLFSTVEMVAEAWS